MRYYSLYFLLVIGVVHLWKQGGSVPIVGGKLVSSVGHISKYPYMVSLQDVLPSSKDNGNDEFRHFCGGSLISAGWILTAAHCIFRKNLKLIVAVIGYENIGERSLLQRHEIGRVEYIYFQPTNYQNDIALLQLKNTYNGYLSDELQFARLPKRGMKANRTQPCRIIGYGATRHAGESQAQLNEAQVYVIRNRQCRQMMGHIWAPQKGESTVCALGDNQDSCQGDSGGPLICQNDGKDYVYGMVSHGLTCGITGIPSIYTVTIPYVDWIHLVMQRY